MNQFVPKPSEKPNRKLNHPVLGEFGFGVKNLPEGISYADQYRKELKSLTKPEREIQINHRGEYKKILGVRNFKELENRLMDTEFSERLLNSIADHLASYLVPDQIQDPELRRLLAKEHLAELSDDANRYTDWVLDRLVPGIDNLAVTNDVIACTDPAKLILMANDREATGELKPGLSPEERQAKVRVRFEALRKAYLMLLMAQVKKFRNQHSNDLDFFNQFMKKIYSPELGLGEHKANYLVSEHLVKDPNSPDEAGKINERNHECVDWRLYENREEAEQAVEVRKRPLTAKAHAKGAKTQSRPKTIRINTPLEMRSFDVFDAMDDAFDVMKNGQRRTIKFRVHTRSKNKNSCVQKLIRKDMRLAEDPSRVISDLNGARFVMEDEECIRLFWKKFNATVGKDYKIEIVEEQNSVGKGRALKCKKFDLRIDGRPFEFQFFTFPDYADYEYSQPYSRDQYEIIRAFEGGVIIALFPKSFYKYDFEKCMKAAIEKLQTDHSFHVNKGKVEFQVHGESIALPNVEMAEGDIREVA